MYGDRVHNSHKTSGDRSVGIARRAGVAAVLTPVVLAGAVAATPAVLPATTSPATSSPDITPLAAAVPTPDTSGVAVVPMAKPPADFRFAASTLSPPPPAAVISSPGGMRIPAVALSAYRKAEQTMAVAAPGCGISWNLLAGIGRIESSHANGGATDAGGTAVRPIYGPALDGTLPGNEVIVQSSQAGRPVYARAMGPMQFLPGTWSRYAADGDGDGRADPQNVFDAALTAARYLCSGGLNLRNQSQVLTAILRYNNSMAYAENVLGWAAGYATGVAPIDLPLITGPVPALGDGHLENPEGLGPGLGLPNSDPLAQLSLVNMGNSEMAGQLMVGPTDAPSVMPSEHGCQVICMASQLPPSVTGESAVPANLPPWMAPPGAGWTPPWMPQAPVFDPTAPQGAAPGPGGPPPAAPAPAPAPAPEIIVPTDVPAGPVGSGALPGPAN